MDASGDPYAVLGVPQTATADEVRLAFNAAAQRFHPASHPHPLAREEQSRIAAAYAILGDAGRRAAYDANTAPPTPVLRARLTPSRTWLPFLRETQVVYGLLEITAEPRFTDELPAPPVNLSLVIDRSTSMQGERLDQVKRAVMPLIDQLTDRDTFSVVAFSDRAEVVVPAQRNFDRALAKARISTLYAGGGTELLQGLISGLTELQRYVSPSAVNHLILLTDGRTYGDEADSLSLASLAALDGINIHGMGIGEEWNDSFLDDLAGRTGGATAYVNSAASVARYFREKMSGLTSSFAERLRLVVLADRGASAQFAFRSAPEPAPINLEAQPIRLGSLRRGNRVEVLVQFHVTPETTGLLWVGRLIVLADVLGLNRMDERLSADLAVTVRADAPSETPPAAIVEALSKLNLYRLQERAAAEAAAGHTQQATQTLERLASRLLASGKDALAKTALVEARRLARTQKMSALGQKTLKFGTRALFNPSDHLP
jgi:Ca-activated chloride channel family protein